MDKLQNKVSVITGAGSGIGKAIALLFASEGSKIVAADVNRQRLDDLEKEIKNTGGEITTVIADVANQEDINNMIDTAVTTYGTLDILVNNAGIMDSFEPAGEVSDDTYRRVMSINADGTFWAVRKALSVFVPKESGVIVNITSLAGINGARGGAAYTMSKHAVVGLTKNTGYIYARKGIRCNAIAPGGVQTNISEAIDPAKMTSLGSERIMPGTQLMPRIGNPDELAAATLFLASDDASFVNGEVLTADGGWSAY
jgi:NAD(P)-dependent dehydrogenase (short-subunit alcohol dehydrogenase family)